MATRRIEKEVDFLLVGLGAVGAIVAHELTRAGRDVLALEAGPPRPDKELVMDELQSAMYRNAFGAPKFNPELPTWRLNERSPAQPAHTFLKMANGLGGSSVTYGAISWRFHPDDFRARSNTIARYGQAALPEGSSLADWPVDYDELEPYYDRAERLIGVSGLAGNLRGTIQPGGNPFEGARQEPYPLPPLRTSGLGGLFAEAADRRGFHPFPTPAAILTQDYDGRQACTYCSFCVGQRCQFGAKGSTLITVLPKALASGKLTVRTGARVTRVEVGDDGRPVGVEYLGPEGLVLQPAGTIVLATYVFENVRLLLLSTSRRFPSGLGNNSGQVGRNFIPRQFPNVFGVIEGRRLNRFMGPIGQGQTIDDLNADNFDHSGLGFIRGGRLGVSQQYLPIEASGRVPPGVPRWGRAYKRWVSQSYQSTVAVSVVPEILPYEANYLDLDPERRDDLGRPVTRITFDLQENDRRQIDYLHQRCEELLREMGASRVWRHPLFTGVITSHDIGGVRMGDDPASSVVDSYGRLHEAPNLLVLGGATYPSLPGFNPTLTMQALALRTAELLSA
jgi:gluconate 2-dehydrogenase alpha chain